MPIKRLQRNTASFPRIGKIRKGGEKPNDRQPGKDLEYFRFDSDDAHALERFEAAYGKEPQQINIYLPYESLEENFQTWQEAYVAGGLKHRCDGETCVIWQKPDGTYSQEPTPCPGGCKEVGRLNVIIPELARLAYVTVETHSINDILQLTDNLQAALALRGRLTGIPFVLARRPQEISTPGQNGKRQRYTKYMLFLEPHPDWVQVQLATMRHNALTVAASVVPEFRQLTVADDRVVDMETGEVVQHRQPEAQPAYHTPQSQVEPPIGADDILADKSISDATLAFVGELRGQERPGAKKASELMHNYAVGVIDGITGEQTHRQVFRTVFRREVANDPDSRLAWGAAEMIFKYLVKEKTVKDASGQPVKDAKGKTVKEPNPDHDKAKVQHIHTIHAWALAQAGQMTIDQGENLTIDPKTGEVIETGDILFA